MILVPPFICNRMAVVILTWLISVYGNVGFIPCEGVLHRYASIRSYLSSVMLLRALNVW